MGVTLSSSEIRQLAGLQRVLLSAIDHPSPEAWMKAVVDRFAEVFEADSVAMTFPVSGRAHACWTDSALDSTIPVYEEYYWQHDDPLMRKRLELPDPSVYHITDILAPKEIQRDMVFAEWRAPNRLYDPLGICLDAGEFIPLLIHAYRDRDDGRYRLREKKPLAQLIAPSFKSGATAWLRLNRLRDGLERMVDELEVPVLMFDQRGCRLYVNRAARAVDAPKEVWRTVQQEAAALAREAVDSAGRVSRTFRRCHGFRLQVALLRGGAGVPAAAAISVLDERGLLPSVRILERQHGLTRRQAEVALLLAWRLTSKEIARELNVRPNTARRHVQAVLRQLGLHSRRDVRTTLLRSAHSPD